MGKADKSKAKPKVTRGAEKRRGEPNSSRPRARGYAIWFPDEEAHLRAIMVLGQVGIPYVGVPGPNGETLYGVTNGHLEALREEDIPFEIR